MFWLGPWGMWDLGSLRKDWTHTHLALEGEVLTTGPPGKSQDKGVRVELISCPDLKSQMGSVDLGAWRIKNHPTLLVLPNLRVVPFCPQDCGLWSTTPESLAYQPMGNSFPWPNTNDAWPWTSSGLWKSRRRFCLFLGNPGGGWWTSAAWQVSLPFPHKVVGASPARCSLQHSLWAEQENKTLMEGWVKISQILCLPLILVQNLSCTDSYLSSNSSVNYWGFRVLTHPHSVTANAQAS